MISKHRKFRELILYVAKLSEADPKCGRTKLNKLLFYSDFRAHDFLGASISGQKYFKLEYGPAPKALLKTVEELSSEKACVWADRKWHGRAVKKLIPLREPDLAVFRPEEIDLIRTTIEEFEPYDATQFSEKSHRFAGWQASELDEEIPYSSIFVDDARPLSPEEEQWALNAIRDYRELPASPARV